MPDLLQSCYALLVGAAKSENLFYIIFDSDLADASMNLRISQQVLIQADFQDGDRLWKN